MHGSQFPSLDQLCPPPSIRSLPFSLLALVAACHLCHSAILNDNEEAMVRKMPETSANKREEVAFLKVEVIFKSDWPSRELANNANLARFKLALYEVEKPETGIRGIYDKNAGGEEIFVFENVPMEWVKTEQKMEGEKGKGKMPTAWTKPKSTELEMQIELPTRQKILRRFCSPELKAINKNKGIRILRVEIGQKHFYKVSLFPDGLFAPHNFQLPPGKGPLIKLPNGPENGGKKMGRKKEIIGGLNYCIQQWAYCRAKRASLAGELKTALVEEREEFEKEQLYRDLEWRLFSLANSHQKLLADYAKEFVVRTEAIKSKLFGIMARIVAYELMSPADETIPPTSNPLSFGSNKCEKREIVGQIVDLPAGCGIDKAIQLRGLTDSNEPVQIEISLLDEQNVTIMKATINESATEMTTKKGDIASSTINSSIGAVKTDAVFYLSLVLTPYNYVLTVRMGSSDVVQLEHWPQQWWQSGIEQIKKMELNGRFILVQKPECSDGGRGEILPQIPWYKKFEEMKVNGRILIKAIPNENAQYFDIILLHDAPEWHIYIGATVMRLRVNFTNDGKSDISLGTYLHRNWLNKTAGYNDSNPNVGNTFQRNVAFELQMDILDKHIEISLNWEPPIIRYIHRMPIWSINWLRVDGNIRLLTEPNITVPNVTKRGETSMQLASLLRQGDVIRMEGYIRPNAASFTVYLLHGAAEPKGEVGDSILRLHFSFGIFDCSLAKNKCKLTIEYYDFRYKQWNGKKTTSDSTLIKDHTFDLEIDVGETDFNIKNNQTSIIQYQEYNVPTWAVDHIWITGDVNITCGPVIIGPSVPELPKDQCGRKEIGPSAANNRILQVHEPLMVGDVIKIRGIPSGGENSSSISLFSGALDWDPIIGKTVLGILFNPDYKNIAFWAAYFGAREYNDTEFDIPDLQPKAKLGIQIVVAKHYYDITLSHDDKAIFTHQFRHVFPIWAVDYIVVREHFAIDGQIELDRAQIG